jgi:hypothetical protein
LGLRVESCVVEEVMLINTIHQEGQVEEIVLGWHSRFEVKELGA